MLRDDLMIVNKNLVYVPRHQKSHCKGEEGDPANRPRLLLRATRDQNEATSLTVGVSSPESSTFTSIGSSHLSISVRPDGSLFEPTQ